MIPTALEEKNDIYMKERKDYREYLAPEIKVISVSASRMLCVSGSSSSIDDIDRSSGQNGDDILGN